MFRNYRPAERKRRRRMPEESSNVSEYDGEIMDVSEVKTGTILINKPGLVTKNIGNLFLNPTLSDVLLIVDDVAYPAHRIILATASDVFQAMLNPDTWYQEKQCNIVLKEPPFCAKVFHDFLKFLYTGSLKINYQTVYPFLCLADKYNVQHLIDECLDYMCNHVVLAATKNQILQWLECTLNLGFTKVAQACQSFLKWNFEIVAKSDDFGNFHLEVLLYILKQNDVVVHDEIRLYSYIKKWISYQEDKFRESSLPESEISTKVEDLLKELVEYIRFPMMSPRQLADLLLCSTTRKYKEIFMDKMANGMSYHSGQLTRVIEIARTQPAGHLLFTPRLYTAEKWGMPLIVENFSSLPMYHSHTLLFSSASSSAEYEGENNMEWIVELYPKGMWFRKCHLIVWQGKLEVPECVLRTVRLTITCKETRDPYVTIGVLIRGVQDGIEHTLKVIQKNFTFDSKDRVLNFDDIVLFDDINHQDLLSPFLVGEARNTLKVHIVIIPLHPICKGKMA